MDGPPAMLSSFQKLRLGVANEQNTAPPPPSAALSGFPDGEACERHLLDGFQALFLFAVASGCAFNIALTSAIA